VKPRMDDPASTALAQCPDEHAFAPFLRALGRGRRSARALDRIEAREAMGMILDGRARPEQIGAFLMLLRVKEETADEIAGFAEAARARLQLPAAPPVVDIDWPSYAGKRRHPPWFLLSALLLADNGHRVLMHGCEPHAPERLFTVQALAALGINASDDWNEIGTTLAARGFAYAPLRLFAPAIQDLLNLRSLFGLRSPVNTFVRHLNPLRAAASLQSLQHPAYALRHADAARILEQPRSLVFRGEGGECELRPDADSRCILLDGTTSTEFVFARRLPVRPADSGAAPSLGPLRDLWSGRREDAYGETTVLGTAAAALLAAGKASDPDAALALAGAYWSRRNPGALVGA